MRVCFLAFIILFTGACNSSDKGKEPVVGAGNNSDTLQSGSNSMKAEVISIQPVKIAVTDLPKDLKFKGKVSCTFIESVKQYFEKKNHCAHSVLSVHFIIVQK